MPLTIEERAQLVRLARQAVEAEVNERPLPLPDATPGVLAEPRGCFVTLTNKGRLRGCIGTFQPPSALAETLPRIAAEAARDGRFIANPVTPEEIPHLTVEVSVLSPLTPMAKLAELRIGTHGIYVVRGTRSGCFLPEVATDMGWTGEQFLDECCASKAGLPQGAWNRPGTRVYLFTSEKFDH
jgi:AmmeMemoRadiSam system protein A